ncbi:hypothetical protein SDC9_122412 [bioreactor metagenome]|uniref:Uncharacterized protein n=1 Tax=bioreactor metagenome TaxID=1076179 RepID=A0A645CEM0_9ZZZZ
MASPDTALLIDRAPNASQPISNHVFSGIANDAPDSIKNGCCFSSALLTNEKRDIIIANIKGFIGIIVFIAISFINL